MQSGEKQREDADHENYEVETEFQEETERDGDLMDGFEVGIPFGNSNHENHPFSDEWGILRVNDDESIIGFLE